MQILCWREEMKTPKLDPGEYCGENRMDFSRALFLQKAIVR